MHEEELHHYFETQRRLSRRAFALAIIVAVGLFLIDQKPMARGLILGAFFSVLNFAIMAQLLPRQVLNKRGKATFMALGSLGARMALMAVPIVLAIKMEMFHFWAVVVGLLVIPVTIITERVLLSHGRLRRFSATP